MSNNEGKELEQIIGRESVILGRRKLKKEEFI